MSNRDRIFPDTTSFPQMTKVSRYFRFLNKICVFPVIIDFEKENVSFKFCSIKYLVFILINIVTFSAQQAGPFLSFEQILHVEHQFERPTKKTFCKGQLKMTIKLLLKKGSL